MTASRARSNSMGRDFENARIGNARRLSTLAGSPAPLRTDSGAAVRARLAGIFYHLVAQQPNPGNFHFYRISRPQVARRIETRAGAARSACEDHVSGLERTECRDV